MAIWTELVHKELLKNDEEFKGQDISHPLERLEGTEKKRTNWGKKGAHVPYAIHVPLDTVLPDRWVEDEDEG